jgi:hypothetical protein
VKPTLDIDIVHVLHIVLLAVVYNKITAQKSSVIGMLPNRVQTGEDFLKIHREKLITKKYILSRTYRYCYV